MDDNEIENMIGLNKNKESPMIYIEKQIYMNIISSLCPDNKLDKKNEIYNKVLLTANYFTKSIYSQKIRKKPEEIKNIFEFLEFNEEEEDIQSLIFKTKEGYEEINVSNEELKDKNLDYFLKN